MANALEELGIKEPDNKPKYRVLAGQLRRQIQSRELRPGDVLPTYAELRSLHGVTISTIDRVYGILEQEGLIERQQGRGTFVTEPKRILTGNIGFIGGDFSAIQRTPFNSQLYEGIHQAIESAQQHLLYLGTNDSWLGQRCEQVDGILLGNIENPSRILSLMPPELPVVSLLKVIDGVISIAADDYNGARTAIQHLWSRGHRRIACLMEKLPSQARRRFSGYHDLMLENGTEAKPEWIRLTPTIVEPDDGTTYLNWGKTQMRQWLREGWRDLNCTAIFVQNETSAIGVMQVLQEVGIKVPEEVSVMGFDGTQLCEYSTPSLCTMKVPLFQIGAKAVEMLNRQIEDKTDAEQSIVFPLQLWEGGSVGSQ